MRDHNRCVVCDEPISVDEQGCEWHADLLELSRLELIVALDEARQECIRLAHVGCAA